MTIELTKAGIIPWTACKPWFFALLRLHFFCAGQLYLSSSFAAILTLDHDEVLPGELSRNEASQA